MNIIDKSVRLLIYMHSLCEWVKVIFFVIKSLINVQFSCCTFPFLQKKKNMNIYHHYYWMTHFHSFTLHLFSNFYYQLRHFRFSSRAFHTCQRHKPNFWSRTSSLDMSPPSLLASGASGMSGMIFTETASYNVGTCFNNGY